MNSRGQAFSTFQLLISAIIALAILVLLLNIIGGLDIFGGQKPSEAASNLVTSQVNSPGELATSIKVKFGREDSLNAKSIASRSGVLTENQLCISKGDHIDTDEFEFTDSENKVLRYNGSASLNVKVSVLCDTGSEIADDLASNGIQEDWMEGCDAIPENQTACVVALRFA